jgi:gamma-glutamylcyclotransferase (GGCT)/AIG2-like uncharacterized protein YtfP
LDDGAISSIFHALKREGANTPAPTVDEYQSSLTRLAMLAQTHEEQNPSAVERMLARVEDARLDNPVDGSTWYALQNVVAQAEMSAARLQEIYDRVGDDLNIGGWRVSTLVENWRTKANQTFEDVSVPDEAFRYDLDPLAPTDERTQRALRKLGYEHYLSQEHPVFVYGTLRSGQGNDVLMRGAVSSLSPAQAAGVAIYGPRQAFPYACEAPDSSASTQGEVVWLTRDTDGLSARRSLDNLEGFDSDRPSNSHYERVLREVSYTDNAGREQTVKAWMYMARGWSRANLREEDRIDHGDWVKARREFRGDSQYGRYTN